MNTRKSKKKTVTASELVNTGAIEKTHTESKAVRNSVTRKNPLKCAKRTPTRGYFTEGPVAEYERQHLEPDELKAFFKAIPKTSFWYPYFFYGCRLSEPALILDGDVSFEKKLIVIKRLKKTREADGYKRYVYSADPRILKVVKTALALKMEHVGEDNAGRVMLNPFLFPSTRRLPQAEIGAEHLSQLRNLDGFQAVSRFTANRQFRKIAREANIPGRVTVYPHVLRHTRATMLLAAGAAPEQVQFLMGHNSLKLTLRFMGTALAMRGRLSRSVIDMGLGL